MPTFLSPRFRLSPADFVALIDEREKHPLSLFPLRTQIARLVTGDYAINGLERFATVEAVESGKITRGAHFDGHRGLLCTKWAVKGFPTVYVVDRDGNMVADFGRGDRMKTKIAELCK